MSSDIMTSYGSINSSYNSNKQEAELMLTNPHDAMSDMYIIGSFAITKKLIACRALLLEVQQVTSARLPWLGCLIALFSTYCHQNRT